MKEKKISVIIPAYNVENEIGDCIESINKSVYKRQNYEIIIVNDGSKDNTKEVIKRICKDSRNMIYYHKRNGGKGSAINYGIKKAKYDCVAITDADCIVDKNWLKNISKGFQNDKIGYVHGFTYKKNPTNILSKIQQASKLAIHDYGYYRNVEYNGASIAFRKEILRSVGGYDTTTISTTDSTAEKVRDAGFKSKYLKNAIVYSDSTTRLIPYLKQKLRWRESIIQDLRRRKFNKLFSVRGFYTYCISAVLFVSLIQLLIMIAMGLGVGYILSTIVITCLLVDIIRFSLPGIRIAFSKDKSFCTDLSFTFVQFIINAQTTVNIISFFIS